MDWLGRGMLQSRWARFVSIALLVLAAAAAYVGINAHHSSAPAPARMTPSTHRPRPGSRRPPTKRNAQPGALPPGSVTKAAAPQAAGTAVTGSVAPAPPATVVVHVAGRVQHPDVYTLPASERVIDAIRLAGGALPDADLDAVNLAAHLQDGEQIFLPSRQMAAAITAAPARPTSRQLPAALVVAPAGRMPLAGPFAAIANRRTRAAGSPSHTARSDKFTDPSQGSVNLNTATPDELIRLPGVGPSTAARIVEFRQKNGAFTSLEDVMNVKGIGPAKFAKMRPFIRIH